MRRLLVVILGALMAAAVPRTAEAGGFEYPGAGARVLGRGGAWYARADDPYALQYNPAALAYLSGTQLMLNVNLGFLGACADREGDYFANVMGRDRSRFGDSDEGRYFDAGGNNLSFEEVCNDGPPSPGGSGLVFTHRVNEQFGFGVGVITPAAVGHLVWGNADDGTVSHPTGPLPAPTRYMLVESQLLILYPSIGAAWSPIPELSFGATFQWGIGNFKFRNFTRATQGEGPMQDVLTDLSATDAFIPRVGVSVHVVPHDNLDITAGFLWSDDVSGGGELDLNYGFYGRGDATADPECPAAMCTIPSPNHYDGIRLDAPQPWQLNFGIRYAHRLTRRPRDVRAIERLSGRVEDPMSNELFDVELDFVYELNSRVEDFVVTVPAGSMLDFEFVGADGMPQPASLVIPESIRLPHRWKDQWSVRLGGDFNLIPGMAALRAGFSYESSGVNVAYQAIDFFVGSRVGIHAGLTVRLGKIDVSLAYAHFFQETVTVPAHVEGDEETAQYEQVSAAPPGVIVNAGTYTSNIDALAVSANYHF